MNSITGQLYDDGLDEPFSMRRPSHVPRRRSDSGSDYDYDEDDMTLGMRHRSALESSASLAAEERMDELQRANVELQKKYMESERVLQKKMEEHETELEDMQNRLDEAKAELSATKREEKELRAKEARISSFLFYLVFLKRLLTCNFLFIYFS